MPKTAVIHNERCDRSPFCPVMRVCPVGAVSMTRTKGASGFGDFFGLASGEVKIDEEKCTGCGKCVAYCPMRAVSMVEKRPPAPGASPSAPI